MAILSLTWAPRTSSEIGIDLVWVPGPTSRKWQLSRVADGNSLNDGNSAGDGNALLYVMPRSLNLLVCFCTRHHCHIPTSVPSYHICQCCVDLSFLSSESLPRKRMTVTDAEADDNIDDAKKKHIISASEINCNWSTDSIVHDCLMDCLTLATHRTNVYACLMSLRISTTLDSSWSWNMFRIRRFCFVRYSRQ
jgi:hypothetical protein